MENAAEALKMAAFVLIFVVSLTITMSSFSEARKVSEKVIQYSDEKFDYKYVDNYTDGSGKLITERIVGAESIIPTVYKTFLENYKIYFFENGTTPMVLYNKTVNGSTVGINFIDLERDDIIAFGSNLQKEQFVLALLYGNKYSKFTDIATYCKTNYKIDLKIEGLYGIIRSSSGNGLKFKEALGEYYQEDENSGSATTDVNKNKKRIITYTKNN